MRDVVTDGGYASLKNQDKAKERGVVNIVFNKMVGTLENIVRSGSMEILRNGGVGLRR